MNNLNKKTIIQIVVIIIAFGGSGIVLYNGMFKKKAGPAMTVSATSPVTTEKVLPYGESMDFTKVLNKKDMRYGTLTYPKLDPATEVGIPEQSLIQTPKSTFQP